MTPHQVVSSIYLGDRACKAILIDSWNQRVAIQIDVISRLRPGTSAWDYYADGDVPNGWLVLSGARKVRFTPVGPIPNDLVNDLSLKQLDDSVFSFEISIGSVDETGRSTEVVVQIEAEAIHIEDAAGRQVT